MTSCGPISAGEDAADQHPGNRLRPERVARGVGGGEAVGLMRGRIEAAAERAEAEQHERAVQHRDAADQPGEHADSRCRSAARRAGRSGAPDQPTGSVPATCRPPSMRDRQRREAPVGRQHRADDAAGRDHHGVVAAGQRLRDRQHQRIAPGEPVVDDDAVAASATADIVIPRSVDSRSVMAAVLPAAVRISHCRAAQIRTCERSAPGCRITTLRASAGECAPIWPSADCSLVDQQVDDVARARRRRARRGPRGTPCRRTPPAPRAPARAPRRCRCGRRIEQHGRARRPPGDRRQHSIGAGSASIWRPPWFDTRCRRCRATPPSRRRPDAGCP